jgi:hypothetical protein
MALKRGIEDVLMGQFGQPVRSEAGRSRTLAAGPGERDRGGYSDVTQ